MSQTNKRKSLVSQMVFYIALLVLNCFILIGCNYNDSVLDNVSEYYNYRLEMKKVIEWIHHKNPDLSNERVHNLARCYIISAKKYNIDYKYTISLGYIESRYKPNQGYLGNFGVQQINWTAHKSRLKDLYDQLGHFNIAIY